MMSSGVSFGLADFLQDHGALAVELVRVEGRVLQDVGENVERERHVLLQHLRVIGGALARGIGVEMAADRLDLLGDRAGAAPLGALEGHVLEEMRDAVDLGRLVAGADIDPDAERDGVDGVDAVGGDPQAVRQGGERGRSCRPRLGRARRAWARTKPRHRADIVRQARSIRSRRSNRSASAGGSGRAYAGRALDRVGEFRRMGAGQRDHRRAAVVAGDLGPRRGDADGGVRIDQHAAARHRSRRSSASVCASSTRWPENSRARRAMPARPPARRRSAEALHGVGDRGAVAALQLEQQPLEIARHLDVHARAEARLDGGDRHVAAGKDSGPGCRCDWCRSTSRSIGSPMRAREMAGIDIAEIAGRHAERHRRAPARRAPAAAAK